MTELGYIVIPLTFILLFIRPKALLYLTVFFSTFTAASVINIESSRTGIQPVYFVGSVWLAYVIIKNFYNIVKKRITVKGLFSCYSKKMTISLLAFMAISFLSIFMPIFLEGKFQVMRPDKSFGYISFTSMNITQYIYLLFMILLAISIIIEVKDKKTIDLIIKVLIFSTLFATLWGIGQFIMNYTGVRYPHELFNNNIAYSQQHGQTILSIKRINSIAVEPSMLALNLVMILPIILMFWLGGFKIFEKNIINNIFFIFDIVITVIVSVLTTSTSAYVGLVAVILLSIIFIFKIINKKGMIFKNRKKLLIILLLGIFILLVITVIMITVFGIDINMLKEVIDNVTLDKLNNQSGIERLNALKNSIYLFLKSPVLGIGWGTYRSYDLFTNLLALTGILGILSFLSMIITSIHNALKNLNKYNEPYNSGLTISIIITTLILFISIPDLSFAYYWIIIILAGFSWDLEENKNENRN